MYATSNDTRLFVDVDGARLRVHDREARLVTAPQIVVLHGGPGFDQGYLRPGLGPLRDVAQLIFVDLRGQGRSADVPVESCTLEQMADDVIAACAYLGMDRPILFGHSAGGFVALHAAVRRPGAFSGLILCHTSASLAVDPAPDPGPRPEPDLGIPAPNLAERAGPEASEVAARMFAGDVTPETAAAFERLVAPYYAGPAHMDVPAHLFPLSPPTPAVIRHFFTTQAARYDLRDRLGDIDLPTLVIAGAHDWICPPAAAHTLANGIPGSALVTFEESGHFSFSEEPQRFQRTIATHLERCRHAPTASVTNPSP